jgi:hypothetical protein
MAVGDPDRNRPPPKPRDLEAELIRNFTRLKPAKIIAICEEGRECPIAIPGRRRRWEVVLQTLAKVPWIELHLMDKGGGLLGVIEGEPPEPPTFEEELDEETEAPVGMDQQFQLLKILVKAQDMALRHHHAAMGTITEGYKGVLDVVFERLAAVEKNQTQVNKLAQQATVLFARVNAERKLDGADKSARGRGGDEGDDEDGGDLDDLMWQVMEGAFPGFRRKRKGKDADEDTGDEAEPESAEKPNGERKETTP